MKADHTTCCPDRVIRKVYAYITHRARLLVFRHIDFPEAGIQIPGGTVEPGDDLFMLWVVDNYKKGTGN